MSQPLPWRLATPHRPACEGKKQEAGLLGQPLSPWLLGLGWGAGAERGDTQRGLTARNKASLTSQASRHRLMTTDLPDKAPLCC